MIGTQEAVGGRMLRGDSWNARRAAAVCVIELGLLFRVAIVGAQERANENVVTAQRPSLAVSLSLMPGKQEFELELRVRIEPPVKTPPEVEFQNMAGGTVQTVKIEPAEQGTVWVGMIPKAEPFGVGYIHVSATGDSGRVERHELRFATRGTLKNQPSVVYSVDGQFAFVALPGGIPADTRFLVNTLELPDPPLPAGVRLEAGPFQIIATGQIPENVTASVAIHLAAPSPNAGSPTNHQVRWLKPGAAAWEALPTTIGSDGRVAQATVSHLGVFVLTSEPQ